MKKVKYFNYAVVGINLKNYKTFLHLSNAPDKTKAKAEFFDAYRFGSYGCLEVVQLPKPERRYK